MAGPFERSFLAGISFVFFLQLKQYRSFFQGIVYADIFINQASLRDSMISPYLPSNSTIISLSSFFYDSWTDLKIEHLWAVLINCLLADLLCWTCCILYFCLNIHCHQCYRCMAWCIYYAKVENISYLPVSPITTDTDSF